MLKRVFTLCTLLLFASGMLLAQNNYVLTPSGKMYKDNEVKRISSKLVPHVATSKTAPANVLGAPDTLEYRSLFPASGNSNFGFFSRDIGVQWFVAPTQIKVLAVGFTPYENTDGAGAEIKIVKFGWTKDQLDTAAVRNWGYYPAVGNNFNDITGFYDNADRTGDWVDISNQGVPSPFAEDIWSDGGQGAPIVPENPGGVGGYQWVEMSLLAYEPIIEEGEVFGVVMSNVAPNLTSGTTDRIGIFAASLTDFAHAWKFYANGRLVTGSSGDIGWWTREFTWDMKVAVELMGDVPPTISDLSQVYSGLSTAPQSVSATITDGNPSGGPSGVASANILYTIDGVTNSVAMSNTSGDQWSGEIPGQSPGTKITYTVDATDVQGNSSTSLSSFSYLVFKPTPGFKTLVVFNGFDFKATGYPQSYYFGIGDYANYNTLEFDHDVWAYGPLTTELVNYYTNIVEISSSLNGPADYNDDVIRPWLAASLDNNYFLAGQEWLGARNGYVNQDFAAGSFEYDILGITHSYNDVSYAASTGQALPQRLFPIAGATSLGDSLNTAFVATTADSLQYDPTYESSDGTSNWMDVYDVLSDVTVDVNAETRGIDNVANVQILPAASHRTLAAGNKVVYMAYDPLYVNTSDPYTWLGFSNTAPQVQALYWFGAVVVSVEDNGTVPGTFNLSQNYPNPFNPSTFIEFSVAERSNVTLKIYDVLGREVAALVNATKDAGNYKVNFDASKLASGLYVYTLNAGSFTSSKKMMLLK